MKKIVVVKGSSQYDALRVFADEIAKGFIELKCHCSVLDLEKDVNALANNIDKLVGCDFVFTFNGIAAASPVLIDYLNSINKTVINFYVDHPYYHSERLSGGLSKVINIFVCKSQLNSAKIISNRNIELNAFVPHGGLKLDQFKPEKKQFETRMDRILFAGSSNLTDSKRPWSEARPSDRICDFVYEALLKGKGFDESYDLAIDNVGVVVSSYQQDLKLRQIVFSNVVPYLRARNRFDTIKQLVKSGIPVDVYGDKGWSTVAKALGINYLGTLPMEALVKTFQEYKFVANDFCAHPNGSHERITNVMLNGAYLITYQCDFLSQFNNANYLSYNSENLTTLSEMIKSIDIDTIFDSTLKNIQLANNHQWYKRSKDIIDLFDLYDATYS